MASCKIRSIPYRMENPPWSAKFVATSGGSAECGWVSVKFDGFRNCFNVIGFGGLSASFSKFQLHSKSCYAFSWLFPHALGYRVSLLLQVSNNFNLLYIFKYCRKILQNDSLVNSCVTFGISFFIMTNSYWFWDKILWNNNTPFVSHRTFALLRSRNYNYVYNYEQFFIVQWFFVFVNINDSIVRLCATMFTRISNIV